MRAFQLKKLGTPPALVTCEKPSPAAGEVLIKVKACGLNFADLLMAQGTYQERPDLPFTMGMELAGTIEACGPGVQNLSIGMRIAAFTGIGGLAEFVCVKQDTCVRLPDAMPFVEAAAFVVTYGTSHLALDHRAKLAAGDTLLVLGAAGGVGLTAVEIGKLMGANVIACARGPEKLAIAKAAGADHLIDSDSEDLRAIVKSLGGADVVYDPVGGAQYLAALRACKPEARIITIGFASGEVPKIPANLILVKNITAIGFYWGGYLAFNSKPLTDSLATLLQWYDAGNLSPHVSHVLPLEKTGDGLELLRSRKSTGKVVITP